STSRCPDMHLRRAPLRVTAVLLVVGLAAAAPAAHFPIFDHDPVDSSTGRPYPILPGTPLILPQPDGKYDPPIVDRSMTGDVDLVVRAGTVMIGPSIPPPATSPRTAVAGSPALVPGSGIPFTVAVSDGSSATATGNPLLGPEMDGIPVLVLAFADFDGDGVIGPTSADDDGVADDARELQESDYLIGRQVSLFHNGVAQGTLYIWKGAPASAGGLRVVLTAIAYVGSFSPSFFFGSVPDGPPVATRMPFFPRYDPDRVVEANGRGGPAEPAHRLGIELEPAFEPPVDDPDLGTPFALPTDGSSPTIDRVAVAGGPMSRLRCVRPSSAAGFPVGAAVPLYRGAAGALYEDLSSVDVPDNGRGTAVPVRLVPVDTLAVRFVPGPAATEVPSITHDELAGHPDSVVVGHQLHDTVVVVVDDPQRDAESVTGAITLNGSPMGTVLLHEGPPPPGLTLPPGQVFTAPIDVTPSADGAL